MNHRLRGCEFYHRLTIQQNNLYRVNPPAISSLKLVLSFSITRSIVQVCQK